MCYEISSMWFCLFTDSDPDSIMEANTSPTSSTEIMTAPNPEETHTFETFGIPVNVENYDDEPTEHDEELSLGDLGRLESSVRNSTDDTSASKESPADTDTNMEPCADELFATLNEATNQFIDSKKNANTEAAIRGSVNKFQKFIRAKGLTADILELSVDQMDQLLGSWVLELKKNDGSDYEPCTITAFVNRVGRYVQDKKGIDIHDSKSFPITSKVITSKKKALKQNGLGNSPNRADVLEETDEIKLWESGALGYHNGESLIHSIWFHTTKLLGFRGCQEARTLKWGDFQIVMNDSNDSVEYIQWNERETKTRHGQENQSSCSFVPKM